MIVTKDKRWAALIVLCLGALMIVLDTTIVNVALPSIRTDLGFSEASLAWVVNAYMLMFGGCMLLGGRLGDLYGPRKLFLIGLFVFTGASLLCGIAQTQAAWQKQKTAIMRCLLCCFFTSVKNSQKIENRWLFSILPTLA